MMIIAIGLLFFSQFFIYQKAGSLWTHTYLDSQGTFRSLMKNNGDLTGWQLHSYAPLAFLALGALFFTGLYRKFAWKRTLYWAALPLSFFCLSGQQRATGGGQLGTISFLLLCFAIFLAHREAGSPIAAS